MKGNEVVFQWLDFAKADVDAAAFLYANMRPTPLEIVCYHCQQSAEKALKSVMIAHDIDVIRTHDLPTLYNECLKFCGEVVSLDVACSILNRYGVQPRYPSGIEIIDTDAKVAIEKAKQVYACIAALYSQDG